MQTKNNAVLITGGASGIGLSLARRFYHNNNRVVILGRDRDKLESAKREMEQIKTIQADVSSLEKLPDIVRECRDVNIIVNNAAIQENYDFTDTGVSTEKITNEIAINLIAPLVLTKLFLPQLLIRKESAIINVSSGLALVPKQSAPVYCATKAALHSASLSLRWQLEHTSVKLFEIVPPVVDTEMTRGRGRGKISPETLVNEFWDHFGADRYESMIGKVKLLRLLARFAPTLAQSILRRS